MSSVMKYFCFIVMSFVSFHCLKMFFSIFFHHVSMLKQQNVYRNIFDKFWLPASTLVVICNNCEIMIMFLLAGLCSRLGGVDTYALCALWRFCRSPPLRKVQIRIFETNKRQASGNINATMLNLFLELPNHASADENDESSTNPIRGVKWNEINYFQLASYCYIVFHLQNIQVYTNKHKIREYSNSWR